MGVFGSVPMRTIAAREAKTRFGELLDAAQREPVAIEKHGRRVAVVLSAEAYDEIETLKRDQLKAELSKGLEDLEAGRFEDGEALFDRLVESDERSLAVLVAALTRATARTEAKLDEALATVSATLEGLKARRDG